MINISEIVATWPVDADGWSISPGVDWCPAGYRVRVGPDCWLDESGRLCDCFHADAGFRGGKGFRCGGYTWAEKEFCS